MAYILIQLGMLIGFFAAKQLDGFILDLKLHNFELRLAPTVAGVVAAAGPGLAHMLMGRLATAVYTLAALVTMLGLVPVPVQVSSISFWFSLIPLWLLNIVDAWLVGRRLRAFG